jgi:hypothetical protein
MRVRVGVCVGVGVREHLTSVRPGVEQESLYFLSLILFPTLVQS